MTTKARWIVTFLLVAVSPIAFITPQYLVPLAVDAYLNVCPEKYYISTSVPAYFGEGGSMVDFGEGGSMVDFYRHTCSLPVVGDLKHIIEVASFMFGILFSLFLIIVSAPSRRAYVLVTLIIYLPLFFYLAIRLFPNS